MRWQIFKSLYLKVFLSMTILVAAVLVMLFFLNTIKLKALMTEATVSRLQLAADMIEAGLWEDPSLKITPHSIGNFKELAEHAMAQYPEIEGLFLFGTRGPRVLAEVGRPPGRMHLGPIFMRVMSPKFAYSAQDLHGTLFSGRRILDPSGNVAGSVVLHLPIDVFGAEFRETRSRLLRRYVLVFILVTLALIPITYFQFRHLGQIYKTLSPELLHSSGDTKEEDQKSGLDFQPGIEAGNVAYAKAEAALSEILDQRKGGD